MMNDSSIAETFCHYVCSHSDFSAPSMIEIGCGNGLAASFMWQQAKRLLLIDVDDKVVEQVRTRMSDNKNVEVRCSDSGGINETFDIVYYFLSLHHIEDLDLELEQAKRLLTKDGLLFICDYLTNPNYMMHKYDKVPHEGFRKGSLVNLLKTHGYHVLADNHLAVLNCQTGKIPESYHIFVIISKK